MDSSTDPLESHVTDGDDGIGTPPSNIQFAPVAMINENGFAQLQLTFDDPGLLDTHTVEIDWGDGTTTTIELEGGERFVGTNHQYLDDNPSGTSQDEYTITVKVIDDDGGMTTGETTVLVKNVAPSNVQFAPVAMINENGFAQLQLTFDDPGLLDTHTVEIDWGDGTTTTIELEGGERFVGTNHQYLDDNPSGTSQDEYTITVKVIDDDGGMTTGVTTVLVKNVAPVIETLTVTPSVITEGNSVTVSGTFSDVGTLDTQTATIRWGDGTVEEVSLDSLDGSGTFTITHFYADNDTVNPDDGPIPDNLYTITVTIADDDGGEATRSIDVSVLNVSPNLEPIVAVTGVNSAGEVTLTIRFTDPGADTLTVYVDWGDVRDPNDPSIPALEPFVIDLTDIEAPGTFTVTLEHAYEGPPNPLSPASAIEIFVFVGDDDLGETFVQADGMSQIRTVSLTNPGVSAEPPSEVALAQGRSLFARQVTSTLYFEASSNVEEALRGTGFGAAGADPNATSDRYLELRVIDSFGNLGEGHRLKIEVLQDLPALFRSLPDKHYAIYLVHVETNTSRLVIEVYVRDGKVIDPGDDSEGTRDRPPTEEATPGREDIRKLEAEEDEVGEDASGARALPENRQSGLSWGPALAGLVATSSYRSWATRVDRTVAQAGPRQWKRLRLRHPHKRKNR
ncbi:MAG: hypothetical protein GXP28_03710 [Planctomycetes bacterium]|nr:hypothetical protein [Planctomycetota bacterium]